MADDKKLLGLKPCPFCGAIEGKNPLSLIGPNEFGKYWVHCGCCACEGPWGKSDTSAIMWWNRHYAPKTI